MNFRNLFAWLFLAITACQNEELYPGSPAPELTSSQWLQSTPIKINKLQNKVVLLRWWTDGCVFCMQSADALNTWHQRYADSGLVVIGMYHPKPEPKPCNSEEVREYTMEKGFRFPVAIDQDWRDLRRYGLPRGDMQFTSVSFLIGKDHRIRYIHPGGEYHELYEKGHEQCVRDFYIMESNIQQALRERND